MRFNDTIARWILERKGKTHPSIRDEAYEMFKAIPADRSSYEKLFNVVETIANKFAVSVPEIFVSRMPFATSMCVFARSNELMVPEILLELLDEEELTAVLGHELHHLRQDSHPTPYQILKLNASSQLTHWVNKHQLPGSEYLKQGFGRYIDSLTEQGSQREIDADDAGTQLTSPEILTSALVKLYAHDFGVDLEKVSFGDAIQSIDKILRLHLPFAETSAKIRSGNLLFTERLANVNATTAEIHR